MIPPQTVQRIKDTARVEEVVGDYVALKRRGSNLIGLCPFHGEKTPSFNVNPARGIFKCFGCGEGGDAISFVMKHDGVGYPEALRLVAARYNIEIEERALTPEMQAEQHRTASLSLANDFARDFFRTRLRESEEGQSVGGAYLKHRGYSDAICERFELGFAPAAGDALKQAALDAGYKVELLTDLGLLSKGGARDFFRDRIVFPIHSPSGKVLAFAGRILRTNTKAPKYLNSPETEVYHKSRVLYAMHLAKAAIRREDRCLIVEGYADVIALHQAGVEHVVATSGTSLTQGHIKLIKRLTERVTFLYDGDKAGVKAALRGLDLVLAEGMQVSLVLLPDGHDPDSYVKEHGGEAFRAYVERHAQDFISYKSDMLLDEAKADPIQRAKLVQEVLASIAQVPDAVLRAEYVRQTGERFQLAEATLVSELNKHLDKRYTQERRDVQAKERNVSRELAERAGEPTREEVVSERPAAPGGQLVLDDRYRERDLVRMLVAFGDERFSRDDPRTVGAFVLEGIEEVLDSFEDPACGRIALEAKRRFGRGESLGAPVWTGHAEEAIQSLAVELLSTPYEYSEGWAKQDIFLTTQKMPEENWAADAKAAVIRFKLSKLLRKMDGVMERMRRAQEEADGGGVTKWMKRYRRMEEVKVRFSAELGSVVLR